MLIPFHCSNPPSSQPTGPAFPTPAFIPLRNVLRIKDKNNTFSRTFSKLESLRPITSSQSFPTSETDEMPSVLGDKEKPGEAGVSETAQVPSVRLTLRASCCPLGRRFLSSFAQGKREQWQVEMPCCCSATLYTTRKLPEREIGCRLLGKAQGRHCLWGRSWSPHLASEPLQALKHHLTFLGVLEDCLT